MSEHYAAGLQIVIALSETQEDRIVEYQCFLGIDTFLGHSGDPGGR